MRGSAQRVQGCDCSVVRDMLGDVRELNVSILGRPRQGSTHVLTGFHERDQRLIRQQDPLLLIGSETVTDDRLPHRGVERLLARLIPHGWRCHPRHDRSTDKETPRRFLLKW